MRVKRRCGSSAQPLRMMVFTRASLLMNLALWQRLLASEFWVRVQKDHNEYKHVFDNCGVKWTFVFLAVSTDGRRVSWKDNFESHYTEVAELGRWQTLIYFHQQSKVYSDQPPPSKHRSDPSQHQHWTFTGVLLELVVLFAVRSNSSSQVF